MRKMYQLEWIQKRQHCSQRALNGVVLGEGVNTNDLARAQWKRALKPQILPVHDVCVSRKSDHYFWFN